MASRCETCGFCKYCEKHPDTLLGKVWKWHTTWCPCWKSYQEELAKGKSGEAKDKTFSA